VNASETSESKRFVLSGRKRLAVSLLALGLLAPLGVAAMLHPDGRGFGTHQQLGLPPCTFRVLFGRRCPSCGMTTSWAYLVRGKIVQAAAANVGGTLLGVITAVAAIWLLANGLWGRWLGLVPNATLLAWLLAGVAAVTLVDWVIRLALGSA
jgi:hypothetical protein